MVYWNMTPCSLTNRHQHFNTVKEHADIIFRVHEYMRGGEKKQYKGREGKTRTRMVSRATETSEAY